MCDLLEHVFDFRHALFEASRVLKPHGWLIISTPNIGWFPLRLQFLLLGSFPVSLTLYDWQHIRFFSKRVLMELLTEKRLKIEKWNCYSLVAPINYTFKTPFWHSLLAFNFCIRARRE